MTKAHVACLFVALLVPATVLLMASCEEDIGIPCTIATANSGDGSATSINGESTDCRSRLCIYYAGSNSSKSLCTSICETKDDCPKAKDVVTCPEGFECVVATEVGSLRCCKMCVCRTHLSGDAGLTTPPRCLSITPNCPKL